MYDLAIIGGGPAGVAAGVYAARKNLKTAFITEGFGGQSVQSIGIQNWIGTIEVSGDAFSEMLKKHLEAYAADSVDIKEGERAKAVEKKDSYFVTTSLNGAVYESKAVLITTGSRRRKLEIPGAKEYENKGITYCASCDGPLFAGKEVVVIGGGNAGFETAAQLLAYCPKVTLLNRRDNLKADPVAVKKVKQNPKFNLLMKAASSEIKGDGRFVTAVVYENADTKEKIELPAAGVFVEIGLLPSTEFVKGFLDMNQYNQIIVDPRTQRSSVSGVWAAGDCTDSLYHQNNIAAGDAVRALEDIYMFLHAR